MISALVLTQDSRRAPARPEAVVRTVAALVPAAVEGVVRDLTLAGAEGSGWLDQIAAHAGAELAVASRAADILRGGLASLRGPLVVVLAAGAVPEPGFIDEWGSLSQDGTLLREILVLPRAGRVIRAVPWLLPVAGLIGTKSGLQRLGATNLATLARRLRPRRATRSAVRITE